MLKSIMFYLLIGIFCSCGLAGAHGENSDSKDIEEAHNAYFQMDHATAYAIYTNVWTDSLQTIDDKITAGTMIAKMDWLLYENPTKAYNLIDSLISLKHETPKVYLLKARILAAESKFADAIAVCEKVMEIGNSITEAYHAKRAYCTTVFESLKQELFLNGQIASKNDLLLQNAYTIIQELAIEASGDVEIAKLYLGYALLLNNGQNAFSAWMSYYRLTEMAQVHPSLIGTIEPFHDALQQYNEDTLNEKRIKELILGMAESGFFEYAMLVKALHSNLNFDSDTEIAEIVVYYQFLQNIEQKTKDFYLLTVRDKNDKDVYINAILQDAMTLWNQLAWKGDKPKFSKELFLNEISKRFKANTQLMSANGYFGLHMGHVILDDRKVINQYKESADFRYISIDHMVSNGYSAWFWDGLAQTGGWANDDASFLQVRSAYTGGPVKLWQHLTDSIEVLKTIKNIKELSVTDDSLARKNPHAFLPGLSMRIRYNQSKELYDSLSGANTNISERRLKFINLIEQINQGASIYAHEGRHAIDKKNKYSRSLKELEFTAKLSEIYFSKKPMFSFDAIMSRNIGDETSHGRANLKVIKGIVEWMNKNKASISGLDTTRPLLPQMDMLTDRQLKEAVKSMDPLAK